MIVNAIQMAGLRAEAACAISEVAKALQHTEALAYQRGLQDGRTLLARELLQGHADSTQIPPETAAQVLGCIQQEHPGSCHCVNCHDPFQVDRRHD